MQVSTAPEEVLAEPGQRWSRGCGLGIGLSGHRNGYRGGVLIGNWREENEGATKRRYMPVTQTVPSGPGLGGEGTTESRDSFRAPSSAAYAESLRARAAATELARSRKAYNTPADAR